MGNEGFFGIGISELVMIAVIALVVLGPERLPSTMRSIAKFLQQVRAIYDELTSQFSDELKPLQDLHPQRILQELTDQLNAEEAVKAKPVAPQPNSPTSNPATPSAIPAKAVTPPVATAPALPSATTSSSNAPVPSGEQASSKESKPALVGDGVIER